MTSVDWHNFKVLSIYGVIVCVFSTIIGKGKLTLLPIIIYSLYGLIICVKEYRTKKKLNAQLDTLPEYIKQIVICHIMKRDNKIKRYDKEQIIEDVLHGNYKSASL